MSVAKIGFILGVEVMKQRPSYAHRVAIFECILGTVYAVNEQGEVKYFDYDSSGAHEWAGITDPKNATQAHGARWYHNKAGFPTGIDTQNMFKPSKERKCLWIKRQPKPEKGTQ